MPELTEAEVAAIDAQFSEHNAAVIESLKPLAIAAHDALKSLHAEAVKLRASGDPVIDRIRAVLTQNAGSFADTIQYEVVDPLTPPEPEPELTAPEGE